MNKINKVLLAVSGFMILGVAVAILFPMLGDQGIAVQAKDRLELVDGRVTVPESRIPTNFDERQQSPPITLLPNRAPGEEVSGKITRDDVQKALAEWESFDPVRIAGQISERKPDPYRERLRRVSASENLDALLERGDSSDPEGVCPQPGCSFGLRWVGNSLGGITIRAYEGGKAYVTGYGAVEYIGNPEFNSLVGKKFYRSYGVLLKNDNGRWILTRVAAETLGEI